KNNTVCFNASNVRPERSISVFRAPRLLYQPEQVIGHYLSGFYKARMKYNPNAIKLMMKDYLSMIYENDDENLVKLNGYIVTAIDGSNFILYSTEENVEKYSVHNRERAEGQVMGQLSLVYDCIN